MPSAVHPLRLVNEGQLVALDLGHELDFVFLHRDLVLVDLSLALAGEVSARPIERASAIRPATRRRRLPCADPMPGADDTGDQSEVRGQSIVESVNDVPQKTAGLRSMPRLATLPAIARE